MLFSIRPAIPVKLIVHDETGQPTTARLEFRDSHGRVYPPQAKRLAPDFFFQPQIYRRDGDVVLLPPGDFLLESSRGPEYLRDVRNVTINDSPDSTLTVNLKRWIDPAKSGFFSGDHHIHAAGCLNYENPMQGVLPKDMLRHIMGEDVKVGCCLTWGPCFDFQKQFFSGKQDDVSRFIEDLLRPYVLPDARGLSLEDGYRAMAADAVREREARAWGEGIAGDMADEAR